MRSHISSVPFARRATGSPRSFGILSTFPPTPCGIATFSAALAAGLIATGGTVDVVRCGEPADLEDALVLASLDGGAPSSLQGAVDALNRTDVVVIQHEYGLYSGADGADLLHVMAALAVPCIVVAHTVVREPSANQRAVLEHVCAAADAVVVMTTTARDRLLEDFDVEPSKVRVIPHGATTPAGATWATAELAHDDGRGDSASRILTWGLLGPGKGIEWAIEAVASLTDVTPRPNYVVAGATHPKVLEQSGETYRQMLIRRAWSSGAAPFVTFDDGYRNLVELTQLIHSANLVVLPYDSQDQVTSGVLVDAVAAGRPVVSTAFPHAVELLSTGAGTVVPQRDPRALAEAIRAVLTDTDLADAMAAEARRLAPDLSWSAVAGQYDALADGLLASGNLVPM